MRRVEPELFTGTAHDVHVENLPRAAKRDFRLSAIAMHRHHDVTFVPFLVLMPVERHPCSASHFRNVALSMALLLSLTTDVGSPEAMMIVRLRASKLANPVPS